MTTPVEKLKPSRRRRTCERCCNSNAGYRVGKRILCHWCVKKVTA